MHFKSENLQNILGISGSLNAKIVNIFDDFSTWSIRMMLRKYEKPSKWSKKITN